MRALPTLLGGLALTLAGAALASPARAGSCGPTCHTVCPQGCDFTSPGACAVGVSDGDTCLTLGGRYHETVTYSTSPLILRADLRFVCADPATQPCVIDGDGVRDHGFYGYLRWEIDGFEIVNTVSHAIAGNGSHPIAAVRRCHIHDIGGHGVTGLATDSVVEGNVIERAFGAGVTCLQQGPLILNNLVSRVGLGTGSGISCTSSGALVLHNTVDVRGGVAPYAIRATTARYNVATGGLVATLYAAAESAENLAFPSDGAPFTGVAGGPSDLVADPLFFHPEDYRLSEASPAIDLATTSDIGEDLDGDSRVVPDAGAFEHQAGDVPGARRWPVSERVFAATDDASPVMVRVPGRGPATIFVDQQAEALVHAPRFADGTWGREVIAADVDLPDADALSVFDRPIAAAVDPLSGEVVVAWVEGTTTSAFAVRVARLDGDVCEPSDCASPRWSGCADPAAFEGVGDASVALAIEPDTGEPVLLLVHRESGVCGGAARRSHVLVLRRVAGAWVDEVLETGSCGGALGIGADLAIDPGTGAVEAAYTRSADGGDEGELVHATDAGGAFAIAPVDLGAGTSTAEAGFTRVAAAHRPDGSLGVAFTQASAYSAQGFGYIERVAGVWSTPSDVVDAIGGAGIRPMEGLDLAFDPVSGDPRLAYARNGVLRFAWWRPQVGWEVELVDVVRDTGLWAQLALDDAGAPWIAYQADRDDRDVRVVAAVDPGGPSPSPLDTCDDGDPCTDSACDPALGCVHVGVDCDDGDACTLDHCDPDAGCTYEPVVCGDGDPCTDDLCDPDSGCAHPPVDCDDGDPCTVDACAGGGCEHQPAVCDDANPCTDGSCVPAVGCVFTPNTAPCDDGDPATHDDTCDDGRCFGVLSLPPVVEAVVVTDAPAVVPPLVLPPVAEAITVADAARVVPPLVLPPVAEGIAVTDAARVVPPLVLPPVAEAIAVADEPTMTPPPPALTLPAITEVLAVSDAPALVPPLVLPPVAEAIAVTDASALTPPLVLPPVAEAIAVTDAVAVVPPLVLPPVTEAIAVADEPRAVPPRAVPAVAEGIALHDRVTVTLGEAPDDEPPDDCSGGGAPGGPLAALLVLFALATARRRERWTPSSSAHPDA